MRPVRALAPVVAALFLLTSAEPAAAALGVLASWGSGGSGESQFAGPLAVAVGPDRSVYIGDTGNSRVQKFTADGKPVARWGSSGFEPSSLGAIHFYVGPNGIAVDSAGNVYVSDSANRVQRFTAAGEFVRQWGSEGSGNDQFNLPRGIATDQAGNVYVADSRNGRVQVFTGDGGYLRTLGAGFGTAPSQLATPFDVALGPDGSVYVVEETSHRVSKFSAAGAFLLAWGANGAADGQFAFPNGIDVDAAGNVWVADSANGRIQRFDPSGQHQLTYAGAGPAALTNPKAIAVDNRDGTVLVLPAEGESRIDRIGEKPPVDTTTTPTAALPAPGPRVVDLDYDPVKRQFFLQVQYRLRDPCPRPCRARAEIRTRTGRRIFGPRLPGDGRLVLGKQKGLALPNGQRVRFRIPVSKEALLGAEFQTVGRYRVAETRMRVWLKERKGELVTVRDGRIRVSIARIQSGVLPGLAGILG